METKINLIVIKRELKRVNEVAQSLLNLVGENGIVILQGDLACGKTTLVKAVALHLGISKAVTSPTFSLQLCYGNRLFHYDTYNCKLERFMSLGLFQELENEGLHLIEWGSDELITLLKHAGFNLIKVIIERYNTKRSYTIINIG